MKTVKLTASEIRSIELFLSANPCMSGCAYPEMQRSKKVVKNVNLLKICILY